MYLNLSQFLKFLIAGGFAAFANIISRVIFSYFFSYEISIVFSFIVGLFFGYLLMRNYVFSFRRNFFSTQIIRFFIINIIALLQTFLITIFFKYLLDFFLENMDIKELIAHIIGVSFPALTSYFAHKYFTFK